MNENEDDIREFTTPNGDAPLHEPILRDGCPGQSLEATRRRALDAGWTVQQVERCYGSLDRKELNSIE